MILNKKELNEQIEKLKVKKLDEKIQASSDIDRNVVEYVLRSLNFANQSHIYHLLTTSFAEHMAIGEFYDGLRGSVDSLTEKALGLELDRSEIMNSDGLVFTYSKDELLTKLSNYRDFTVAMLDITNESAVQSLNDVIIDIQKLIDELSYKLKLN